MNSSHKPKISHVIAFTFLLMIGIVFGGNVSATDVKASATRVATHNITAGGAEVRVAYQNVLDATEAIAKLYGITGAEELIEDARNTLSMATDEELAPFVEALPEIRKWHQLTETGLINLSSLESSFGESPTDKSDPFPNANYYWPLRANELIMIIGLETMNTATGVQMIASRFCDQVAVIVGEGANTALLCLVTDAIYIVALFVWNSMERVDGDFTSEEVEGSYRRLEHVHDDLNGMTETIDSILAILLIHVDEFRTWISLDLRTKIENNLARHGQQVHPLASFILPDQYGGHLEVVRQIVSESINNMIAAGQRVFFAEAQLIKGDDEFASGNYKSAYDYYGEAYLSATK